MEEKLSSSTDFEPRPYQIYLFEKAVEENTIIYLPTGTGKTYIAVLLIKHMSSHVTKAYKDGGKRTVFIVNTVSLVQQQCTFLMRHTALQCKGYTGDMNVDFWTDEEWLKEIESNQVLVMTAQIFLNLVEHGTLPIKKVNLIIFDECHRAVKDHPMRQIMQRFEGCPVNEQPRVLGMSATLLNSNVKANNIDKTLKELEITFNAKIITIESLDSVANFATKPKEFIEYYDPSFDFDILKDINIIISHSETILDMIDIPNVMANPLSSDVFKPDSKTVKINRILSDVKEHLNEMGLWGGNMGVLLHLIQLELNKKFSDEQKIVQVLEFIITQLMKIQKILSDKMGDLPIKDAIYRYSSPKVTLLVEVLRKFHANHKVTNERFCCIIFVQRRFTAQILYHILKKLSENDETLNFLKPDYILGYNNDPYKNAREMLTLSKRNKKALTKFRSGSCNCIIATDVIDEGVDVPSCTLIVRYYAPLDFRSYVQSKGRARHSTSHYIIMAEKEKSQDYLTRHSSFINTESYLRKSLHGGKTDLRNKPTEEEIRKELYTYVIEPYEITKADGTTSIITENNAVSLVNHYCACLVKSKFILLTPAWVKIEESRGDSKYRVALTLPSVSPLRETIIGDAFDSLDDAKRSVAVKTCIKLYEMGQLDENLLPVKVEDSLKLTEHLFPFMEKESDENGIPGTNKKKRRHELVHAEELYQAYPKLSRPMYLHLFDMKTTYPRPNDNRNMVFYDLLNNSHSFGILSSKKLPEIPSFPIFMNVGELQVNVNINNQIECIESHQLDSLKVFHSLIFDEILAVIKDFMVFDFKNLENSFLIVPTIDLNINWEVVDRYKKINYVSPSKPIQVRNSEYDLSLVMATHRASNVYIVTEVCEYLKAGSRFPTPDYETYVDYYKQRHDQVIDPSQNMLEVKQISKKINCIKPRKIKANISKRKRESLTEDFEEHLVPELCKKIDFPASYWLKSTTLPSVLHRISQLLVAENLRRKIAKEADLNLTIPKGNHKWGPLIVDEHIMEESKSSIDETTEDGSLDDEEFANSNNDDTIAEVDVLSEDKSTYSWTYEEEPPDLVRNADQIEQIDIKRYFQFLSKVTDEDKKNLKHQNVVVSTYQTAPKISAPKLKVLEEKNVFGPSPADIMMSLTAKMSNDVVNYERAETLGDSFLKYAVSLFLYQTFPDYGEGPLTYLKGKLVGNRNLYYCAKQKQIPGRLNVEDFSPNGNFVAPCYSADRRLQNLLISCEVSGSVLYEISIPPGEKFSGQLSDKTIDMIQDKVLNWPPDAEQQSGLEHFLGMQIVSDKTVSDSVEAIIGTYLSHLGIEGALKILKYFEILPKDLDINDFCHSEPCNPCIGPGRLEEHTSWADKVEKNIGYKFNNRGFLLQAFSHPSYSLNRITGSYQRLEFLGDAVLDFLLTVYIYENCGNLSPGELTDLRSALVNNITFACLTVRYGLHTALLQHSPKLFEIIDRFVKFQEQRNHVVDDELLWVLSVEDDCNMAEHVDVPKALGDIYESVVGAVFLDSNKNLQTTWNVIYSLMKNEIDTFKMNVPKQPIRVIHETQGANPKFSKAETVESNQSTVMVTLSVQCGTLKKFFHGFGTTKKLAKNAASKQAIKYLKYKR